MSFALGPLNADGTSRTVRPNGAAYDFGARGELGIKWLYPGVGEYVGVCCAEMPSRHSEMTSSHTLGGNARTCSAPAKRAPSSSMVR